MRFFARSFPAARCRLPRTVRPPAKLGAPAPQGGPSHRLPREPTISKAQGCPGMSGCPAPFSPRPPPCQDENCPHPLPFWFPFLALELLRPPELKESARTSQGTARESVWGSQALPCAPLHPHFTGSPGLSEGNGWQIWERGGGVRWEREVRTEQISKVGVHPMCSPKQPLPLGSGFESG